MKVCYLHNNNTFYKTLDIDAMLIISDVDECSVLNGGCHQVCTNTQGSYYCSCNEGYQLEEDNSTCAGATLTLSEILSLSLSLSQLVIVILTVHYYHSTSPRGHVFQ